MDQSTPSQAHQTEDERAWAFVFSQASKLMKRFPDPQTANEVGASLQDLANNRMNGDKLPEWIP